MRAEWEEPSLKFTHRIAAFALTCFVFVHVGHHVSAAFGIDVHRAYGDVVLPYYQHPYAEPALIVVLFLQAVTGVGLAMESAKRLERRSISSWVELIAGFYFFVFISIHLAAVFVTRYHYGGQTDFFWAAELMKDSAMTPVMIGFHFLGVVAIFIHLGLGLKYFGEAVGAAKAGRELAWTIIAIGVAAAAVGVAAYSGVFFSIDV